MFDRIGRIADETPFVMEWFIKNGVCVWSTQEGEGVPYHSGSENHRQKDGNKLCTRTVYNESVCPPAYLGGYMKSRLENKLIRAILGVN